MKECSNCAEEIPSEAAVCPLCKEILAIPPFKRLLLPRTVGVDWLPDDLRRFYGMNEGIGLEFESNAPVRLATLDELLRLTWKDLDSYGDPNNPAWTSCDAIRLGASDYGDEICYMLNCPVASKGSIMAFGEVAGSGGTGPHTLGGSLVLSASFDSWISRLKADGWTEFGITPGEIAMISADRIETIQQHFRSLNPKINWPKYG
jgi:hypothetical protein